MSKPLIDVAVGVLVRPDGHVLLGQRPEGKPWAGWWELPGGKLEPHETPQQALARELHEELGIHMTAATPWITYVHTYPKTTVKLRFHRVTAWQGQPEGLEDQQLAWVAPTQAQTVGSLLPAAHPPLRWMRLPTRYLITGIRKADRLAVYLHELEAALRAGVRLVQFREPAWANQRDASLAVRDAFLAVRDLCHRYGAACLINSCHPQAWWPLADGVHYRAKDAAQLAAASGAFDDGTNEEMAADAHNAPDARNTDEAPPDTLPAGKPGSLRGTHYVAVSAHNEHELAIANQIQADFAVLGHVLQTASHPVSPPMGWQAFAQCNEQAGLPVFALGGQSASTLDEAKRHGAHGIAAINGKLY